MERDSGISPKNFDYTAIPLGYYDSIANTGKGMRAYWHQQKFSRVAACLPEGAESILDIGCFSGTFLGNLSQKKVKHQVGVDILEDQVNYAKQKYENTYREFHYIKDIFVLERLFGDRKFQNISLIEVIEHLSKSEIKAMFVSVSQLLETGGRLIITTPNYNSLWPLLELVVNKVSRVKYEEQHITKFKYFNLTRVLQKSCSEFDEIFQTEFITTTHFISPFLASFSHQFARKTSNLIQPSKWKFPFGTLF